MCESVRIRDVGFVDVKALAFVVPKECLDPETFAIDPTSFLGRFDVGDQMDGFPAILSPPVMAFTGPYFLRVNKTPGAKKSSPLPQCGIMSSKRKGISS